MTKRIASASVETHKQPAIRLLLKEVVGRWQAGESPDARAVIERNPEIAADKSVVIDLAYEEFCLRVDAGETIDRDAFCDQFPDFRKSLYRRLEVHDFLAEDFPGAGQTVFGLKLIEELGRGALGRVFLAEEVALGNRRVAVKFASRGQYEADFLGRLRHPNIVPVSSVKIDTVTGLSAVVMPYLGRTTLADFSDTDLDKVLGIVAQLAEALAYTHSRQIVHRDLKPTNVLMGTDGCPMLMDFNLSTDLAVESQRLGGTLHYMAPEQLAQLSGEPHPEIDGRADIYSLGVILGELLIREPHAKGVDSILVRCLAYLPESRFGTAQELASALRQQLRPYPRTLRWVHRHSILTTAAAVLLSATTLSAGYAYATRPSFVERERTLARQALAAGHFDQSIEHFLGVLSVEPDFADDHFMLGRARLRAGDLPLAYEDFSTSYRLSQDGRSAACVAYLTLLLTSNLETAKAWHERARVAGFDSPEMNNNDGYCYHRKGDLVTARQRIEQALADKPELATAILNLVMIDFQDALGRGGNVPQGLFDAARETCPASDSLFQTAALATLLSDPTRTQATLDLLEQALRNGANVDNVRKTFAPLHGSPDFEALLARPWNAKRVAPIYVSDPLGEFPAIYAAKYD